MHFSTSFAKTCGHHLGHSDKIQPQIPHTWHLQAHCCKPEVWPGCSGRWRATEVRRAPRSFQVCRRQSFLILRYCCEVLMVTRWLSRQGLCPMLFLATLSISLSPWQTEPSLWTTGKISPTGFMDEVTLQHKFAISTSWKMYFSQMLLNLC